MGSIGTDDARFLPRARMTKQPALNPTRASSRPEISPTAGPRYNHVTQFGVTTSMYGHQGQTKWDSNENQEKGLT